MNKAFVVMSATHHPISVFLIPEMHTNSHLIGQLHKAAEGGGRYGMLVDVIDVGAPQAADIIKKMEPERSHL